MKKLLSVLLAVTMLFAVCVPAFAADTTQSLTEKPEDSGTVIIKTTTDDENGEDAAKYVVTIPADTTIPWGKTETALEGYTVESHLLYGQHIEISVEGNDVMALTEDAAETLAYTLSGDTAYTATSPVVNPAAELTLKVNITADDWANAIVGEYQDTLTFTAKVVSE